MAYRHDPAGVFQSAGRGHRRRSRSVQYGSAVRYALRSGGVRHRNGNTGYRWRFVCCGFVRVRRSCMVVLKTGIHSALAAQGFPVQVVALDAADDLNVMD